MATKKKTATKGPAKKATPAKKPVKAPTNVAPKKAVKKATPAKNEVKKKAAPAKKAVVKKAAPSKKSAPAKVVAKKAAPAPKVVKKVTPDKKSVTTKTKATNVKKETTKSPAKKATAPAKKAEVKKAVPAKKIIAPAKKAEPVKVAAKAPAAPAAPAKKAAPAPAPAPVAAKKVDTKKVDAKKAAAQKAAKAANIKKATPAQIPAEKPKPTRRNAREEGKTQVIVAHRRLENKSKSAEKQGKTMINYQPDFTRSILDTPEEQQGPVYRYSDEELNEFRVLITSRLEAARKELGYLQGLITRKDEAGTDDTENRYMNMEDGSGAMEREQLAQLASRQIQFINHLEKAMMRIENKTYGICRVTGKLIDKARLRAVPHATLSIDAKKMMSSK